MTLLVAVVSAALGALLAGAANLRLAQRAERRAARAGASELETELRAAKELISVWEDQGEWWDPLMAPSTAAWDVYQQALVAQLQSGVVTQLQQAVQTLHDVNARAALRQQAYAATEVAYQRRSSGEVESRAKRGVIDPAKSVEDDRAFIGQLDEPSMELDRQDRAVLDRATQRIDAALAALREPQTKSGLSEPRVWWQRGPLHSKGRRAGAVLVLLLIVGAVLEVSWVLAPEGKVSANAVANSLAAYLTGEGSVDCDARPANRDSAWTCDASFPGAGNCPEVMAANGMAGRSRAVLVNFVLQNDTQRPPGCGGLERYKVNRLQRSLNANAAKVMASPERLEAGDPEPARDGANLSSGMVAVPVNDGSDAVELNRLEREDKKAWWMFWR